MPGAGPFSQAVVVAVCNDATVAAENFRVVALLWQCLCQDSCLLASLSQVKKVRRKSSRKLFFLCFWGPGGTPRRKTSKNACLQKSRVATGAKSMDFGTILGRPGGSLGALFWHLGPPRRDFARPRARKRTSGRGSGRDLGKMERK